MARRRVRVTIGRASRSLAPVLALALVLAALIGLSLGTLGGGGSILTVPTLLYAARFAPKQAIAASLLVVGATSLVGAMRHRAEGNVRLRVALIFGALSFVGAFGAARLSRYVSGEAQVVLLAVVMLAAAVSMLRPRPDAPAAPSDTRALAISPRVVLAALAVGMLTGLVGIGGGFLFVPALTVLGGLSMREAVGTSTAVIAINALGGLAGYRDQMDLPWGFLLLFTAVAIAGIVVGTRLVRHIPQAALRRAFAVFLLVVGAFMLWDKGRKLAARGAAPAAEASPSR